jgi:hypothetical protein
VPDRRNRDLFLVRDFESLRVRRLCAKVRSTAKRMPIPFRAGKAKSAVVWNTMLQDFAGGGFYDGKKLDAG